MKKVFSLFVLSLMCLGLVAATPAACNPNQGAIWTTNGDCGDVSQDVNHYMTGDKVFINGANFCPGTYNWDIAGNPFKPEDEVASGSYLVDSSGSFCFEAYTVGPNDSGEYSVDFGKKNDNYRVNQTPVVPEFGTTVGILTALGALGAFFFVRRK